jgi:hypothetical protein
MHEILPCKDFGHNRKESRPADLAAKGKKWVCKLNCVKKIF